MCPFKNVGKERGRYRNLALRRLYNCAGGISNASAIDYSARTHPLTPADGGVRRYAGACIIWWQMILDGCHPWCAGAVWRRGKLHVNYDIVAVGDITADCHLDVVKGSADV
jgi:hypothetical protein